MTWASLDRQDQRLSWKILPGGQRNRLLRRGTKTAAAQEDLFPALLSRETGRHATRSSASLEVSH